MLVLLGIRSDNGLALPCHQEKMVAHAEDIVANVLLCIQEEELR